MTEGDKVFCKRAFRQELYQAQTAQCQSERELHLQRARYFEDRLDGKPKASVGPLPLFV